MAFLYQFIAQATFAFSDTLIFFPSHPALGEIVLGFFHLLDMQGFGVSYHFLHLIWSIILLLRLYFIEVIVFALE